ncbi:MAG: peptidoglycan bridge formation glycyltransferase FemA/FemB family protein [Candidatus Limnocylindrales bacterium]
MTERSTVEATRGAAGGPAGASDVDLAPETSRWDAFVARSNPGSYLQTSAWAEVKAPNGWVPLRFIGTSMAGASAAADRRGASPSGKEEREGAGEGSAFGVQLLIRKPRAFPWAFAYAPRGPVFEHWNPATLDDFTGALRQAITAGPARISHVRIEPEIELNGPADVDGEFRHALRRSGWRPGTPIQPPRTRQVDLRADEAALWGDLRKKWRQYVNKARKSEVRVVDATADRLPEFYSIYLETAKRAGFVIRTYESYLGVWRAFARLGMARLLMAEGPDGAGLATLFLLRVGDRVIEPYGGMTEAGGECRANYLLKWEAIRTSREQGAASYDMWGISHEGIEHFKAGFGGREIMYVGAWDLVLDPAGRLAFDTAQVFQDRIGAWRHGIGKVRGRPHAPVEEATE